MSKFLKVFGVVCGILAFLFCLGSGISFITAEFDVPLYNSLGLLSVGMAFFTGPLLIILSLKSGQPARQGDVSPAKNKPKAKPAGKAKSKAKAKAGKPAEKDDAKSEPKGEITAIYVGNLSPEANQTVLKTAFSGFGEIYKIKIIKDRGRPKGFAFVEMYGREQALKAIETMNGEELAGRPLSVSEAKTKQKSKSNRPKPKKQDKVISDEPIRPNIFE